MDSTSTSYEPPWRSTIAIGTQKTKIDFKLDSGADITVIPKSVYDEHFSNEKLTSTTHKLRSAGQPLPCLGKFVTLAENKDHKCEIEIFVVDTNTDCLLSRTLLVELDLVQRVDTVFTDNPDPVFGSLSETPVKCNPVKVVLKDDHQAYSVPVARRIPIPLLGKVRDEVSRLQDLGVIEAISEPTDWCSPIVPVLKKDGSIRLTTDFKHLNKAVKRERYMLPSLEDITHKLAGATIFSKIDVTSAFFQLPLDPESGKKTTFITPFGRYFYKRLPQGITSAPEIFQRTMEEILVEHQAHTIVWFDDILVHSKNNEDHERDLSGTLNALRNANVKLKQDKCEFRKEEVTFLGFRINKHGIHPEEEKIKAIVDMPSPTDIHELRRFLGMTNFLGRHLKNLSSVLHPLNALLRKEAAWCWGPPQEEAFNKVKVMLTSAPTLAFYDASRPTTVSADASSYGLGAVLLQDHDGVQRPVAYCSRSLTPTEQRYAQIEKELLASVWACERFNRYLVGLDFTLLTDHKPLIPLINSKDLSDIPIRCQRLMIRISRFAPHAVYCPGKDMQVPDTLSRCPSTLETSEINVNEAAISDYVGQVTSSWPVSDKFVEKVREETQQDMKILAAIEYTLCGWPAYKDNVNLEAREFFPVRAELSVVDGLLTFGDRICIPSSLRSAVLQNIHQGHQGITKCRERAKTAVWWPGISAEIKDLVASCAKCIEKQPAQRHEPLNPSEPPKYAFQRVGTDLFHHDNHEYLVLVDYYSRYIEIALLSNQTSKQVIAKLKTIFARHGIPQTVVSDNATQFSSQEFVDFANAWNFTTTNPSPRFPQSNGQAEAAVKIAKSILDQEDPTLGLLVYRSTPLPNVGLSPAELLFGRRLRTTLPVLDKTLTPRFIDPSTVNERDAAAKEKQKFFHDRHHSARPLSPLRPGDSVLIRSDDGRKWRQQPAEVVSTVGPRSLLVSQNGRQLRRNRRHLLRRPATTRDATPPRAPPQARAPSTASSSVRVTPPSVRAPRMIAPSPTVHASPSVRAQSPARASTPPPASTPVRARASTSSSTPVRAMTASSMSSAPQRNDNPLSGDIGPPTPTVPPIGRPKRLTSQPANLKDYVLY